MALMLIIVAAILIAYSIRDTIELIFKIPSRAYGSIFRFFLKISAVVGIALLGATVYNQPPIVCAIAAAVVAIYILLRKKKLTTLKSVATAWF